MGGTGAAHPRPVYRGLSAGWDCITPSPFPSPRPLAYTPHTMSEPFQVYLAKAEERLLGTASELDQGRYNTAERGEARRFTRIGRAPRAWSQTREEREMQSRCIGYRWGTAVAIAVLLLTLLAPGQ